MKKVLAGAATLAAAAATLPLLATPAFAATNNGGLTLSPQSGTAATQFSLAFPGATIACPGDSASGGYRVQSFVVPAATNLDNLTFTSTGPNVGQPLYASPSGNALVNGLTNITTGVVGQLPGNFSFSFDSAGDFSTGAYQAGIACTQGTGAGMTKSYWSIPLTLTVDGGGNLTNYSFGAAPAAPTAVAGSVGTVTGGNAAVNVSFTEAAATPAVTSFSATLTPTGAGSPITVSGAASPIAFPSVPFGTYNVSVTATNSAGTSAAGTQNGFVVSPPPYGTPGFTLGASTTTSQSFNIVAPAGDTGRTGYTLTVQPLPSGTPIVVSGIAANATTATATGLTTGSYSATLQATYPAPFVGATATISSFTIFPNSILQQNISVTRPAGALVLTQVCGANGAIAADPASPGFPSGIPAITAVHSSTVGTPDAFAGGLPTGETAAKYAQYPYPVNPDGTPAPTYPTQCGISLPNAQFVTKGAGAGQFFSTSGNINQITVVNTKDQDVAWNATGQASQFSAGPGKTFSGSQLGWTPVLTDKTGPFADASGNSYSMAVSAGGAINPNTSGAGGLGASGKTLLSSVGFTSTGPSSGTGGLGIAIGDARLKLLIPITAQSGAYTATLTFTVL